MIEVSSDDKYWAKRAVVAAAISYVDYFFAPGEDGVGLDGPGGELIRAVRELQRVIANDGPMVQGGDSDY